MRRNLVAGNWKMHGTAAVAESLLGGLVLPAGELSCELVVCPPFPYISPVMQHVAGSPVGVGGQDCSEHSQGAYTGEVAASMLADLGCGWVILGHSERRQYQGESSELVAAKARAAREAGLTPILCIGETLAERQSGDAEKVVTEQLLPLVGELRETDVVAYEPVWAIGTGETATPAQAQEMHAAIRGFLAANCAVADQVRVLYGGSVKPDNARELFAQHDIDGGLVGGASLKAEDFLAIGQAANA
jgi:triosephosphate isomerase